MTTPRLSWFLLASVLLVGCGGEGSKSVGPTVNTTVKCLEGGSGGGSAVGDTNVNVSCPDDHSVRNEPAPEG